MIKSITIDREYGSGAADIAATLAARLGSQLWDELLTFMRDSFEGTSNAQRVQMVDADRSREAAESVVREAARDGNCVIVGRGSAYYLQSNPDAFHLFVYAPLEEKLRRLRTDKSEEAAHMLAETVGQGRTAYIKQYFKVEWPFHETYDLTFHEKAGSSRILRD